MAGVIGPDLKERIRDANDIVDVINSYVPLKRAGANFMALCPFHKEKTPSFNVNPSKQIFHCFGCHKGGDVFTFVQEFEHLSFPEAAKRLAERARIPLEWEDTPEDRARGETKEQLYRVHEELAERWHRLLVRDPQGEEGRAYLEKRGLSEDAVKQFRIGFAPNAWSEVLNWAKGKGYEVPLLQQAGLITSKEGSDHFYDRFRRRLMFPITDIQGRVIGFSGRVIDDAEKGGKYVNSPETPIFKKGRVLFGMDKARQAALEAKALIVCEGQLDTIACHINGIRNVVAPQGTALTAGHARVIKNHVNEVILCFDSDTAGQNAVQRSFDDLLESGTAVRVATIPAPHDPDSYIKEFGADAFRKLTDGALGFFDHLLERLGREHDRTTDSGRRAIVQVMSENVKKTGDAVLIDTYAQKTSYQLGVSVEAVRQEFSKSKVPERIEYHDPEVEVIPEEIPLERPSNLEFWLLKLVLGECEAELLDWLFQHLDIEWVCHPVVREALVYRLDQLADGRTFEVGDLLGALQTPGGASLITEAAADNRAIPKQQQQLTEIVTRLRNLHVDRELRALSASLEAPNLDDATQLTKLQELQALRQTKQGPLEPIADA